MKRRYIAFAAVVSALIFSSSVFADNKQSDVTAVVVPNYTITIPTQLSLTYNDTDAQVMDITAANMLLHNGGRVVVTASGSGQNDAFTISNGTDTVAYELSNGDTGWDAIAPKDELATFSGDGKHQTRIKVPDWNSVTTAGTYSGTLTFTIEYITGP